MTRVLAFVFCFLFLTSCRQELAPVHHFGMGKGVGSSGVHVVSKGDTLWSISNRYKIAMQDLVMRNQLTDSFTLSSGQRIHLPPPREYTVRSGDTIHEVARLFNVSASAIVRLNNLESPYTLTPGQVVRLPSQYKPQQMSTVKVSRVTSKVKPQAKPKASHKQKTTSVMTKTPKRSSSKFLRPVEGRVVSNFGAKKNGLHNDGINILASRGTNVAAAENGVVVYAGNELKGSGNLVLVRHEGRYMTAYAHLDRILIKRGAVVKRGQTLGTVGNTGMVSRPQLHFEVRRGTKAMNPEKYLEG